MKLKMIDVFNLVAKGEIKEDTVLVFNDRVFEFLYGESFIEDDEITLESIFDEDTFIGFEFLNTEVYLVDPEDRKLSITLGVTGRDNNYLGYNTETKSLKLGSKEETAHIKTAFTDREMYEIKPVDDFLNLTAGGFHSIVLAKDHFIKKFKQEVSEDENH